MMAKHATNQKVFSCIIQNRKSGYDFELCREEDLADTLLELGNCYVNVLDVRPNDIFLTQFDNAGSRMPDDQRPYVGMLNVITLKDDEGNGIPLEKDNNGSLLIWINGQGYDYDDYREEKGELLELTPKKYIGRGGYC